MSFSYLRSSSNQQRLQSVQSESPTRDQEVAQALLQLRREPVHFPSQSYRAAAVEPELLHDPSVPGPSPPRGDGLSALGTALPSRKPIRYSGFGPSHTSSQHLQGQPRYSEVTGRFTGGRDELPVSVASNNNLTTPDSNVSSNSEEGSDPDEHEVYSETPMFVLGQPHPQPCRFQLPTDAQGGFRWHQLAFIVDFNDPASIKKANKAKSLVVLRAKDDLGIEEKKRPSTAGREYSATHDAFIQQEHTAYANANANGHRRIPIPVMTDRFNTRFPGQNRTRSSVNSHIDRLPVLKAHRRQYDGS